MVWQEFNVPSPLKASQPVIADLINTIVNNLQVIKEMQK